MRTGFINRRAAVGRIAPYTIASYAGPDRGSVVQATGGLCEFAGVTDGYGATGDGMVELRFLGEAEVRAGGPIAQGDMLTADDRGRAVPFAGPIGTEACILGQAAHAAGEHELCRAVLLPPWPGAMVPSRSEPGSA